MAKIKEIKFVAGQQWGTYTLIPGYFPLFDKKDEQIMKNLLKLYVSGMIKEATGEFPEYEIEFIYDE